MTQRLLSIVSLNNYARILFIVLVVLCPSFCLAATKSVLLLNSYSYDMEWTRSITESVAEKLGERQDIDLLVEFLDTKKHTDQSYYSSLYKLLRKKYINKKIDLIITSDDNAARFVLDNRDTLFQNVPVVFCGVNNTNFPKRSDFTNITGVLEVPGFKETLLAAKYIFPQTQHIYLINESVTIGEGDRKDLQAVLDSLDDKFTSTWLEDKSAAEISRILNKLPENSVVLLLSFFGDKGSGVFSIPEGAAFISQQSVAPVFSMWDYFLGKGIIGGLLTSGTYQGYSAAKVAMEILDGLPIENSPVISTSANRYMFDKNILDTFKIKPSQLPEGSIVINNPPSIIELYKYSIVGFGVVFFVLVAVISFLLHSARVRRRMELNLKTNEERLRLAMEANLDGLWDWDVATGEVYYSPGYISMLGYSEEDTKGHVDFWGNLIHPDDAERALQVNTDCIDNKLSNFRVEFRMKAKDGQWRWILGRGSAVERDENGKALRMTGTHTDVTDRKRIEQELMQAQKMEAIGTLAGGIAHDFNNLLVGIQGRASLALRQIAQGDLTQEKEHLSSIVEYSNRAAELTKQLLGFARSGKYNLRPTNVNTIILNTAKMFGRTKKELTIEYNLADDIFAVDIDRGQIEQVLLNLYVNAWQAMQGGGSLTIETRNIDPGVSGALTSTQVVGRQICIKVSDTGTGIKQELLDKIYEPFFTTKERGRGTGLGLASAYGIIQNHSGSINVNSVVGQGTSFEIYLPATSKEIIDEPRLDDTIVTGEGSVLVVDDEAMVLDVTSNMLRELGYQVHTAQTGESAISLYLEHKNEIDLVVLDMIMPGISGRETFDKLMDIDEKIKVILSSGYSLDGQASEIMQSGCKDFIQKPFDIKELSLKLDKVINT